MLKRHISLEPKVYFQEQDGNKKKSKVDAKFQI